jgi:hypothetical protein
MHKLLIFLGVMLISGCLYVPTVQDEPYSETRVSLIRVNETVRSEILAEFGEPDFQEWAIEYGSTFARLLALGRVGGMLGRPSP